MHSTLSQHQQDECEAAYWRFDAMRKGYGPWKECPWSERDAFKATAATFACAVAAEELRAFVPKRRKPWIVLAGFWRRVWER